LHAHSSQRWLQREQRSTICRSHHPEWSYAIGEKDVNPKHLQAAAELLTLHRDVIRVIDAAGQKEEAKGQSEASTEEANEPNPK